MIVVDTNVLSDLLRSAPESAVLDWFDAQPAANLYTTSVTQAEMLYGARLLPASKRHKQLVQGLEIMFDVDFSGRVLGFDAAAAPEYADVVANRRQCGRPISQFDAQIAAIARLHGADLATRNTRDFESCGIDLIDPWQAHRQS